jgi:uncharacterized protein YbaA (DUF1428 family)
VGDLTIKVEAMAGADCRDIIHQMAALASHLRVAVEAKLNDVVVWAPPHCDSRALGDAWHEEMISDRKFKMVSGRPFVLGRATEAPK